MERPCGKPRNVCTIRSNQASRSKLKIPSFSELLPRENYVSDEIVQPIIKQKPNEPEEQENTFHEERQNCEKESNEGFPEKTIPGERTIFENITNQGSSEKFACELCLKEDLDGVKEIVDPGSDLDPYTYIYVGISENAKASDKESTDLPGDKGKGSSEAVSFDEELLWLETMPYCPKEFLALDFQTDFSTEESYLNEEFAISEIPAVEVNETTFTVEAEAPVVISEEVSAAFQKPSDTVSEPTLTVEEEANANDQDVFFALQVSDVSDNDQEATSNASADDLKEHLPENIEPLYAESQKSERFEKSDEIMDPTEIQEQPSTEFCQQPSTEFCQQTSPESGPIPSTELCPLPSPELFRQPSTELCPLWSTELCPPPSPELCPLASPVSLPVTPVSLPVTPVSLPVTSVSLPVPDPSSPLFQDSTITAGPSLMNTLPKAKVQVKPIPSSLPPRSGMGPMKSRIPVIKAGCLPEGSRYRYQPSASSAMGAGQRFQAPTSTVSAGLRYHIPTSTVGAGQRYQAPTSTMGAGQRYQAPTSTVGAGQRYQTSTSSTVNRRIRKAAGIPLNPRGTFGSGLKIRPMLGKGTVDQKKDKPASGHIVIKGGGALRTVDGTEIPTSDLKRSDASSDAGPSRTGTVPKTKLSVNYRESGANPQKKISEPVSRIVRTGVPRKQINKLWKF